MKNCFKTTLLVIFNVTFLIFGSFSQNTNIWYFGHNAGIDFSSGSPVVLTNGALDQVEGCASICDDAGALLFYTDGITVYNSMHNTMQNGTGLNGYYSSTQAAIIVPFPGSSDNYYIFTTGACNLFCYSVVDMTQASGLGAVTVKNDTLLLTSTEKVTAVKAANGTDYWVVVHETDNNLFYAYAVTSAGVSSPVISAAGSAMIGINCVGNMKLNPQGTQLAMAMEQDWTYELFDFDNVTGIVSNGKILGPMSSYTYSCEFSPSGHYLYVNVDPSTPPMLYQFDVSLGTAAAINASMVMVGVGIGSYYFGTLQNAPDGKIYVAEENQGAIGVINNPEAQGIACNFVSQSLPLNGSMSAMGLPNYVTSYFDITTGIPQHDQSDNEYLFYPNPLTTQSKLSFENNANNRMLVKIFDITGKLTENMSTSSNEIIITKGSKPAGVYLFSLVNEQTGKCMNGKIVISH